MRQKFCCVLLLMTVAVAEAAAQQAAAPQQATTPYVPQVGQAGKDVVWVPTPPELVEAMLNLAKVTPQDYVMDLGSGDGRNIIGAAKRGARAVGVEYNGQMVELSRRNAAEAGVAEKATFVEGDMYVADISKASVLALFLLPSNMIQLRPKFLNLAPGSRIVSNTFGMEGWTPDETDTVPNCTDWCNALLWIVPAKVEGTWRLPQGQLTLKQEFQVVSGTLGSNPISEGKLRGNEIAFTVGTTKYTGRVNGNTMEGTAAGTRWTATRVSE
jgi:SAM-dependent methyltransferase